MVLKAVRFRLREQHKNKRPSSRPKRRTVSNKTTHGFDENHARKKSGGHTEILQDMKQTKKKHSHALFWTLLKQIPGYNEAYKEVIKEGIVSEASKGKTESLSELYEKYPREYSLMIEKLKGDYYRKQARYEDSRDKAAKRVIAAICAYVDKLGYKFVSREAKIRYVMKIACRAANCWNFNAIPESRLSAIYNLYCKRNSVNIYGNPELDFPPSRN